MYLPSGNNYISGSGMSSTNTWIISTTAKTITNKWITEESDPYNDMLNDSISVFFSFSGSGRSSGLGEVDDSRLDR